MRIAEKFHEATDFKNVNKKRWKNTYKVIFDTFTLFSSIMIRCSGDGLTSVGNYFNNWTVDTAIDSVAEAIMTRLYSTMGLLGGDTRSLDYPKGPRT